MQIFLKRIELQGFKSFAQKIVLEFPNRVVAVVGPNGSGKSNVIDALRWVLGEREAKQLRGDTLGNLIFAGTPKRPQAGFARVALTFDNHNRMFELQSSEVVLTRRIDRNGVSEFSLNDDEIKLKDLIPILARARLGTRGLTMIGQGQSDVFVKSSPIERRGMVEEVLGLREFRVKKAHAERRLETSAVNMEKVHAILEEIGPHLRFLRKQKHRFEKRSEIEVQLREIENNYFASRYHALHQVPETSYTSSSHFHTTREKYIKEIAELEKKIKELHAPRYDVATAKKLREEIDRLLEKKSSLEHSRARFEAKQEFSHTIHTPPVNSELYGLLLSFLHELKEMLVWNELETLQAKLRTWYEKFQPYHHEKKLQVVDYTSEIQKIDKELHAIDEEIQAIRKNEEVLLVAQEHATKEFQEYVLRIEEKKNALRDIDAQISARQFEEEKIRVRKEELEREWRSVGRTLEELYTLVTPNAEIDTADAERKMVRLRGELSAIGEIDQSLVKEAEDTEARAEFLTRELEDLEHASQDLKKLIRELDHTIHTTFKNAFKEINDEFQKYFQLMFGGGRAKMKLKIIEDIEEKNETFSQNNGEMSQEISDTKPIIKEDPELSAGIEIDLTLPRKRITSLDMLSGGEKSLVSLAALFALIAVSPPPFLVLDEIDAPLDEMNARRFSELIKNFSSKTQFIIVTHNRTTMEAADILYGVTMGDDGVSKVLSVKFE